MKKSIIALLAVVGIFAISSNSYAVPAFARLNGMACSTCHYQQFPMLNPFGRDFKANGYTMVKKEELVEGDNLSLPHDLTASLVTKIRYQQTNGGDETKAKNHGDLQFPDEAGLLLGGRVAENVGFLLEASLIPGEKTVTDSGGDTAKVPETNLYTSFKMPFVYDVAGAKASVIPFTTDSLGVSYGFELLNTGAVRNVRVTEHRDAVSAQQYLGTDGAATGIAFVGYNETGYVNYSLWKPVHGSSSASFLNYLRIAATPQIAGWDVGVGAQIWSGTSKDETASNNNQTANAWAADAQAQGMVANMPLGIYLTYGSVSKGSNAGSFKTDSKATAIAADLGVLPSTQVTAALRIGDSAGQSDNAITVGARHLLAQNVQLSLNHSIYSGDAYDPAPATGNQLTTLMLFAAF